MGMISIQIRVCMSSNRSDLLQTTMAYLETQKSLGKKYVRVSRDLLESIPAAKRFGQNRETRPPAQREVSSPAPIRTTPKSLSPDLETAWDELRKRALACQQCAHLASFRKQVVFGVGNPQAELMFVGEAPGADEDRLGEPFVGKAGQLLTKMIQAMGLQRSDVYIANVLKCRPNVDTPTGNRKPTPEEMETCVPYLKEQIKLVKPKALVAVGDTAVKGLIPELKEGITRLRGKWLEFEGIPLMPTFHPSYMLHNPSNAIKRQCWEDLLAAMEKLEMPISEKQRNYFLSAIL
jgi:uracil-DNA glycosylase